MNEGGRDTVYVQDFVSETRSRCPSLIQLDVSVDRIWKSFGVVNLAPRQCPCSTRAQLSTRETIPSRMCSTAYGRRREMDPFPGRILPCGIRTLTQDPASNSEFLFSDRARERGPGGVAWGMGTVIRPPRPSTDRRPPREGRFAKRRVTTTRRRRPSPRFDEAETDPRRRICC